MRKRGLFNLGVAVVHNFISVTYRVGTSFCSVTWALRFRILILGLLRFGLWVRACRPYFRTSGKKYEGLWGTSGAA